MISGWFEDLLMKINGKFYFLSYFFMNLICEMSKIVKNYPNISKEYQNVVDQGKKKLRGLIAEKNCIMLHLVYVDLLFL